MHSNGRLQSLLSVEFDTIYQLKLKLRPTVSRPLCLAVGLPSGTCVQNFLFCLTVVGFFMLSSLFDERMGL
jgi:hypothetical protein